MIECKDSLDFLKERKDYENDIIFADPPYALGSEIIVRPDGKIDYKKAVDFMGKWEMPDGKFWEQWFKEAYRSLKYGGYCVLYGIDRQTLLFKYYAALAGFQEQQSLYWLFLSSMPKAVDLSKMLDKHFGMEREVIGTQKFAERSEEASVFSNKSCGLKQTSYDITIPAHDLAKKYDGLKYSVVPLKQTNETIMVFMKPCKTGSPLQDTLAYENGDKECCCSALNIEDNRIATDDDLKVAKVKDSNGGNYNLDAMYVPNENGRYPSQTIVDEAIAEKLDEQTSGEGKCSKILHVCDFESDELELYYYAPKVSKTEREAGTESVHKDIINKHPTLKPIALNRKVLSLFKTPNPQRVCFPFAGAGSEVIGGIKAGFDDYTGCELSQEYVDIAKARIAYYLSGEPERKVLTVQDADGNEKKVLVEQLDMFD